MPTATAMPAFGRLTVLQWTGVAFVYWIVFMGALAPGTIVVDINAGVAPNWTSVLIRLIGAGALGASVTPLLLALAKQAPVAGRHSWRNLGLQALAVLALSPALILVSCFLVAWLFEGVLLPSGRTIVAQLAADDLLLVLCLSLFLGAIQLLAYAAPAVHTEWVERLTLSDRGAVVVVDVNTIEWIESQGNYQALHTTGGVHLFRETSEKLLAMLDPACFARIHRRYIVALAGVRRVEALANGDGVVKLSSGTELRLSRQHRRELRKRLDQTKPLRDSPG